MGLTVYGGGGKPEEEKTVTAGTSAIEVSPSSGKVMKKVTVNPTPSQAKTVNPTSEIQVVTPDTGKLLSQVTVGKSVFPTGIAITTPPTKVNYTENEALKLSGIVVTGTFDNGVVVDITDDCTFSPANGTILTSDDTAVTVSFLWGSRTYTTTQAILVRSFNLITWAGGTDEEIVAMVEAADAGKINLSDYWSVGDTRTVHLSAMNAVDVSDSHAEQDVEFVLMHAGGYELVNGKTANFIVGQKDSLVTAGYMSSSYSNSGSWHGSLRRNWCNSVYKNALPSTLLPIFKQFKTITAQTYNGSTNRVSVDYFALPAEREVFGSRTYSNSTEFNALFQFDYYKTASNRVKKLGKTGSAREWFERSPSSDYSTHFCIVNNDGSAFFYSANNRLGLAPFGCI